MFVMCVTKLRKLFLFFIIFYIEFEVIFSQANLPSIDTKSIDPLFNKDNSTITKDVFNTSEVLKPDCSEASKKNLSELDLKFCNELQQKKLDLTASSLAVPKNNSEENISPQINEPLRSASAGAVTSSSYLGAQNDNIVGLPQINKNITVTPIINLLKEGNLSPPATSSSILDKDENRRYPVNLSESRIPKDDFTSTTTVTSEIIQRDEIKSDYGGGGEDFTNDNIGLDAKDNYANSYGGKSYKSSSTSNGSTKSNMPDVPSDRKKPILDINYEGNNFEFANEKPEDRPVYKTSKGHMSDDGSSNVFVHLVALIVIAVMCYLVFHNKHRIIALVLEGKDARNKNRRDVKYRKLDSNLEEAMATTQGSKVNLFNA